MYTINAFSICIDDIETIIDFGMSKLIDLKFKKKIKEERPNYTLMNLGFIIKLKEFENKQIGIYVISSQAPHKTKKNEFQNKTNSLVKQIETRNRYEFGAKQFSSKKSRATLVVTDMILEAFCCSGARWRQTIFVENVSRATLITEISCSGSFSDENCLVSTSGARWRQRSDFLGQFQRWPVHNRNRFQT